MEKKERSKGRKITTFCRRVSKVVNLDKYFESLDIIKSIYSTSSSKKLNELPFQFCPISDNHIYTKSARDSVKKSYIYKFFLCTEKDKNINLLSSFTFFYLSYSGQSDYFSDILRSSIRKCITIYKIPEKLYIRGLFDLQNRYQIFDTNAMLLVLQFFSTEEVKFKKECDYKEKILIHKNSAFRNAKMNEYFAYFELSFQNKKYFLMGENTCYSTFSTWQIFSEDFQLVRDEELSSKVTEFLLRENKLYMCAGNFAYILSGI